MTSNDKKGFFDDWPAWAKLTLTLAALVCIGGVWVGLPVLSAVSLIDSSVPQNADLNYMPMISVLIAMTTATITGIFLFMSLRIDRGTRNTAEKTAKKTAKKVTKKAINKAVREAKRKHDDVVEDSKRAVREARQKVDDVVENSETVVREAVSSKITEEALRKHVENVLMVTANWEIVREYTSKRAGELDLKSIERLMGVMEDAVKFLSQHRKEKRKAESVGFWAGLFNK